MREEETARNYQEAVMWVDASAARSAVGGRES